MKNTDQLTKKDASTQIDEEKRDFLFITTTGLAIAGGGAFAWSMIDTMNPSKDVLALSTTEVDLSPLEEGQSLTVMWRGKPIFIRHRTKDEISSATNVTVDELIHKETDDSRVKNPKWLVVVGVCSHLGYYCHLVKKLATVKVNLVVGFALVMVHITTPLEELEKALLL